jgi:hypothetical protein
MSKIIEFFGEKASTINSSELAKNQYCPYRNGPCSKRRKNDASLAIGICAIENRGIPVVVCPERFMGEPTLLAVCYSLLSKGDSFDFLKEVKTAAGFFDYVLFSHNHEKVVDYLCLEVQALDTCGSAFKERMNLGLPSLSTYNEKNYGINWKMTSKTILTQLLTKLSYLEKTSKKLVLAVQDVFCAKLFTPDMIHTTYRQGDLIVHSYHYSMKEKTSLFSLVSDKYVSKNDIELALKRCPETEEDVILKKIKSFVTESV